MTLIAFIFFMLGMLSELVLLYEGANRLALVETDGLARHPLQRLVNRLSPGRMGVGLMTLAALLLAVSLELAGFGAARVYIDSPVVGIIFVVLGVFLFFAGVAANLFLPSVNEQTILAVQGLVVLGALWGGQPVNWLPLALLTVVPAALSLVLLAWRRPFPPVGKALLYLWYLFTLMVLPFQSGQVAYFRQADFSAPDAVAFGGLLVFMIIHGLFTIRFFLIASSLLRPRNRALAARLMPRLFRDEQAEPRRFLLVVMLIGGLLLANNTLALLSPPAAVGVCTLLVVQLLNG